MKKGKPIIPVKLDNSDYNDEVLFDLVNLDYIDYCHHKEKVFPKLMKTLENRLGGGVTAAQVLAPVVEAPVHKAAPVVSKPKGGNLQGIWIAFWGIFAMAVVLLILLMLRGNKPKEGVGIRVQSVQRTPAMVDMGLSVKWASCNIGASSLDEFGDFYAWGELNTKQSYEWDTYKWNSRGGLFKYTYGLNNVDQEVVVQLEKDDDIAYVISGGKWRMPTNEEFIELENKCKWRWSQVNGAVYGYRVTGPSGNTIFFPATGYMVGDLHDQIGIGGYYWSLTLNSDDPSYAHAFSIYEDYISTDQVYYRSLGFAVRPVEDY